MRVGSLFSGGGLGDFGFVMAGHEIVWQVEIDEYCQKILALRYPESKKYRDIKTLKGADLEPVGIITAGVPCQPASTAGLRRGEEDSRWLWPEAIRIIECSKPAWVVFENPTGIISLKGGLAFEAICSAMESKNYEVFPIVFPSCGLEAPHKRHRVWLLCHSKSINWRLSIREKQKKDFEFKRSGKSMGNTALQNVTGFSPFQRWWSAEPDVGRVANGVASRVDRLKMLGNGQTPCSTYVIGKFINEIKEVPNG